MIDRSNIINLNSYIRINFIRESFEKNCMFVGSFEDITNIDVYKDINIIFENTTLKTNFYESLNLKSVNYTVINCLSSVEIFESLLHESKGLVIFDNVCSCRNNEILEKVVSYKGNKLLVC